MKRIPIIIFIIVSLAFASCDDIFLNDITGKSVNVICPSDSATFSSASHVLFWWEALDGADYYELQIVRPGFGNITELKLDKTLDSLKYTISLPAGTYQWRIKGINSGYESKYLTRTIFIQSGK